MRVYAFAPKVDLFSATHVWCEPRISFAILTIRLSLRSLDVQMSCEFIVVLRRKEYSLFSGCGVRESWFFVEVGMASAVAMEMARANGNRRVLPRVSFKSGIGSPPGVAIPPSDDIASLVHNRTRRVLKTQPLKRPELLRTFAAEVQENATGARPG